MIDRALVGLSSFRVAAVGVVVIAVAGACGGETRDTLGVGDGGGGTSGGGAGGVGGAALAGSAGTGGSAQGGGGGASAGAGGGCVRPDGYSCATYTSQPGEGRPPEADPTAPIVPTGAAVAFVAERFYLGDTGFDDQPSTDAWRRLGYNLDGFTSDKYFDGSCRALSKTAKTKIRNDGDGGIDNAFGQIVLTSGALPLEQPSQAVTARVREGSSTFLLVFGGLGPGASYTNVRGDVVPARTPAGVVPTFAGTDGWSPLVSDGIEARAFPDGYVTEHTWVSGAATAPLVLELFAGEFPLRFVIHAPIVTARLSPDHMRIERGMVAGLLGVDEFVNGLRPYASSVGICGEPFEGIADTIRNAADSLLAGGQDPAKTCDAISVGFAFTGVRIGSVVAPPIFHEASVDGCGGGGTSP